MGSLLPDGQPVESLLRTAQFFLPGTPSEDQRELHRRGGRGAEEFITWETQQTDYPSTGPDSPEYEPRGCPRGASFSWYTYSPARVRYPYVRGPLLEMWRETRDRLGDPVLAWAEITGDPERTACSPTGARHE